MVETEFCSSQVGNWNGSISMFIILLSTIITLVIAQTIPDYSISEYEPTGQLPPGCSSAMLGLSLDGYTMVSFGCNNSNWQFNVLTNSWMKLQVAFNESGCGAQTYLNSNIVWFFGMASEKRFTAFQVRHCSSSIDSYL
eukprot:TRINITY_DN2529_c0_g1_i1.p2 TRINITY_DN2529_c0_g1~~TRINITY_DN2529_c0_g1_i1.p2  ORF type:complete len:139 (+),score=6.81 TRINITY_DN2529_c0_g1_i1:37-453(+)